MKQSVEKQLAEAEQKAWASLASYKFGLFGYWANTWMGLNRYNRKRALNPFETLVKQARAVHFGTEE